MIKNLHWNKIISVGSNLAQDLFNRGIESESLEIIPPPVDTEKFHHKLSKKWLRSRINVGDNETLLIHASRIDSDKVAIDKGVYTLLKAFSLLKSDNIKLLIACAPTVPLNQRRKEETIGKLKESAKLLKIGNQVVFETFEPQDMHHVYAGGDLFVMASKNESFGLVYAEALSCGIPVIGTSVGGIPEIVDDGKSGHLVQPGQHVELAKTIKKMLRNRDLMRKRGLYGRKQIEDKINIEKVCKNLLGICESVIKSNKKGSSFFNTLSNE
jgi:glycosyltransferase involved in cell wall biosynthesis